MNSLLPVLIFMLLFGLLFLGVPLGFALGFSGLVGFGLAIGWGGAVSMISITTSDTVMSYNLSVLPLFILMGALFSHARMADDLYRASNAFLGHLRGGLAMATILACGGFSAVSGSAMACAATMTKVSVPIMRRYGYQPGFAAGTVAAGSTLDILIPPSVAMVIYAIMTEVSLGKLMIAGFLPGLLTIGCYLVAISAVTAIWPGTGPAGERSTWRERWIAANSVWSMIALFAVVIGGIYLGVFTPTEAAGVGAVGALFLALANRRLTLRSFVDLAEETARITSNLFVVLVGAIIFANFITVSGASAAMEAWVSTLDLHPTMLIITILAIYIVLGCVLDGMAMMVITVPIFFPIISNAGIDPIWFGIFVVIVVGIGMITPPIGMLLFVVRSMTPGVSIRSMVIGVLPFLAADVVRIALIIIFPVIVLFLPGLM